MSRDYLVSRIFRAVTEECVEVGKFLRGDRHVIVFRGVSKREAAAIGSSVAAVRDLLHLEQNPFSPHSLSDADRILDLVGHPIEPFDSPMFQLALRG